MGMGWSYDSCCNYDNKRSHGQRSYIQQSGFQVESYPLTQCTRNQTRGYVLIFMNTKFRTLGTLNSGGQHDKLCELFEGVHFSVRVYGNAKARDIEKHISEYANRTGSCFIVFLSSHGSNGNICGSDDKLVKLEDLFRAANTLKLKGKPKLFFIDACRTGRRDSRVPELLHSDFFVGYSCLSRQTSYDKGGGLYFKLMIDVYKDGLKYPAKDHSKERTVLHWQDKISALLCRDGQQQCMSKSSLTKKLFLHNR
ncbi:cell death protein 3-like [Mytilus edulis]|uniref:cell death protein 3-like n=1 Tax=Mytilus edulis TaxID=6550 RepID=UPI0039F00F24